MKKMPTVSNSRMICILLALAIHALALWGCSDGSLEITPQTLLVNSENNNERQSDKKATMATFTCVGIPPNEIPRQLEVVWMKDGLVVETVGTRKYVHHRRKKQLVIKKLDEMDSGLYECAISPNSTEKGVAQLWISPQILSAPSPQFITRASPSAGVECQVTGGHRTVDWHKNQLLIASSDPAVGNTDPRYNVSESGSLLISSVARNDKGLYTCIVRNPAGDVEKHVRVRVTNPITGTSEPTTTELYKILPPPRNLSHCVEYNDIRFGGDIPFVNLTSSVSGGSSGPRLTAVPHACVQTRLAYRIVLSCVGTGSPTPSLSWTKDGRPIPEDTTDNHYIQLSNGSLLITKIQLSDTGNYTCTASSSHGNVVTEVQLEVRSNTEQCGVKGYRQDNDERVKRIVRGFAVSGIHQWPWQVLIEYEEDRTTSILPHVFCGGALVRPDWIVTAAHCLYNYNNHLRPVGSLVVRTGVHNRTHGSEIHQQLLKAQRYIIHPSYDSQQIEHDIALIQLSQPVRPSPQVGTVCLPPQAQDPPVGSMCTVTGWGTLQHQVNEYPELLHQGDVPLVSLTDCTSRESYGRKVTDNMLCAGWKEGGADACQNDSGGPLVCEAPGNEGRWALYGIVNYGQGCGDAHKYGIYARVTKYLSWIDTIIGAS